MHRDDKGAVRLSVHAGNGRKRFQNVHLIEIKIALPNKSSFALPRIAIYLSFDIMTRVPRCK